jgi:hydrogenase maturation protease
MAHTKKTIIIGLGNPILGDDGVGWKVIAELSNINLGNSQTIDIDCLSNGGLTLMERLVGYHRAILVDALQTGQYAPGTVMCLQLDDLPDRKTGHMSSAHDVNFKTALQLGREMGIRLPEQIIIIGIEAQRVIDFSEELSTGVEAAVPQAVQLISDILQTV